MSYSDSLRALFRQRSQEASLKKKQISYEVRINDWLYRWVPFALGRQEHDFIQAIRSLTQQHLYTSANVGRNVVPAVGTEGGWCSAAHVFCLLAVLFSHWAFVPGRTECCDQGVLQATACFAEETDSDYEAATFCLLPSSECFFPCLQIIPRRS